MVMRVNQRPVFGFTASVATHGALEYSGWQVEVGEGTEVALIHFLYVSLGAVVVSVHDEAVIVNNVSVVDSDALFAPDGYALKATIVKGSSLVAPKADGMRWSFDLQPGADFLSVPAGKFIVGRNPVANNALLSGLLIEERTVDHQGWSRD